MRRMKDDAALMDIRHERRIRYVDAEASTSISNPESRILGP
jgi:hypothetical protein